MPTLRRSASEICSDARDERNLAGVKYWPILYSRKLSRNPLLMSVALRGL